MNKKYKNKRYNWKTSESLYKIFCVIVAQKKEITFSELLKLMKQNKSCLSEQLFCLEKEEIIKSRKKGKMKLIKINVDWFKKIGVSLKLINLVNIHLKTFKCFNILIFQLKNYGLKTLLNNIILKYDEKIDKLSELKQEVIHEAMKDVESVDVEADIELIGKMSSKEKDVYFKKFFAQFSYEYL